MASKTISLLLIASYIIQIYAKCPHYEFVKKHLIIDNSGSDQLDMVEIGKFAATMAPQRMISATRQTIYVVTDAEKNQMTTVGRYCLWNTNKPKVTCEWSTSQLDKYDCNQNGRGYAYHTGIRIKNKLVCPAPLSDTTTPLVVENYSTKEQVNDFAEQNRQYQPSGRKIFAITGNAEWIKNESVNSCKLKDAGIEFKCERYWQCRADGTGNGRHRTSDGHLE